MVPAIPWLKWGSAAVVIGAGRGSKGEEYDQERYGRSAPKTFGIAG